MKISKTDFNKIVIPGLVVILICLLLFLNLENIRKKKYVNILNSNIEHIISIIKEQYPNASEEEIIRIIQSSEIGTTTGKSILKQYGYDEDDLYSLALDKETKKIEIVILILFILCGILVIVVGLVYIIKQNKKIDEVHDYLQKINNGNYGLMIQDNNNTELSKLRNDLYKTTVLLREAAENSKKENKNLSDSLADISHQIKTPITSIQIMIDNLCENPNMDENIRNEFLKTINEQVNWISTLVIEILKLSKIDSGTIEMSKDNINIKELINDVEKNLSILLDIKNIEIIKDIPENAYFIADYKWQLEGLTNIIKNALEHSDDNSKIHINVENTSIFLKIQIIDNGSGIAKEDLKHIFDRFYKSNSSDNNIGIGLSLAKTIIEKNNGYITVDSKLEEGTTFTIKYLK